MELRLGRVRPFEWLAALAGAVLLGALFGDWYRAGRTQADGWSALGVVPATIVAAAGALALILAAMAATHRTPAVTIATCALMTLLATVATALVAYRAAFAPDLGGAASRAAWLWVALGAAAGMVAGGWLDMDDDVLPERLAPPVATTPLPAPAPDGSRPATGER